MLGMLCGILWTAAAFIQFSYAEEKEKALVSSNLIKSELVF
jgi:hypothetical protein